MTTYSGVRRPDRTVEELLERYAFMRLEPDRTAMARIRSAVMVKASERAAALPRPAVAAAAGRPSRRSSLPFSKWSLRQVGVSLASALMVGLVAGGSAFASSRAGGPLYDARLWVETMTLPSPADARVEAELGRAELRLAEAAEAAEANDEHAVAAALTAYARIVGEELGGATDATIGDEAALAIEHHRTVLVGLLAKVPPDGREGIENALAQADLAIARMTAGDHGTAGGNSNSGGGDRADNPDSHGANGGAGNGNGPEASGGGGNSGGTSTGANGAASTAATGHDNPQPSNAGIPGAGNAGNAGNGGSTGSGDRNGAGGAGGGSQGGSGGAPKPAPTPTPTPQPTPTVERTPKPKPSHQPRSSTAPKKSAAPSAATSAD